MPRISRNQVQFMVGNVTYLAAFQHEHAEEDRTRRVRIGSKTEHPITKPLMDGTIKLRHKTTCRLRRADEGGEFFNPDVVVGEGVSRCSVKDVYDWRKGIKRSFVLAIAEMLGIAGYLETPSGVFETLKNGKKIELVYEEINPQVGPFLSAFFHEMRIALAPPKEK